MISVTEFIRQVLKKKNWTLQNFADEINKVKELSGIHSKTTRQNVSNFLNHTKGHDMRPKTLVIWEKALGLPDDVLVEMVEMPKSKNGKKELEEIKKSVRQ